MDFSQACIYAHDQSMLCTDSRKSSGKAMTRQKRKKNSPWGIAEDSTQAVAQRQVQKAEIPSDSELRFGDKPL